MRYFTFVVGVLRVDSWELFFPDVLFEIFQLSFLLDKSHYLLFVELTSFSDFSSEQLVGMFGLLARVESVSYFTGEHCWHLAWEATHKRVLLIYDKQFQ